MNINYIKLIFISLFVIVSLSHPAQDPSGTGNAKITFYVTVDCYTPPGETVCLAWSGNVYDSITGTRINPNTWRIILDRFNVGDTLSYMYCRNKTPAGGYEVYDNAPNINWRKLKIASADMTVYDTIVEWKWLPKNGKMPKINASAYSKKRPMIYARDTFMNGVCFIDWYENGWEFGWESTLDKIVQNCRGDWIQYWQGFTVDQYEPTPILVGQPEVGTPHDVLEYLVKEAHKRGLKVYLNLFPGNGYEVQGDPGGRSISWYNEWFNQLEPIILDFATFSNENNVEMIDFDVSLTCLSGKTGMGGVYDRKATSLLKKVKKKYKGLISTWVYPCEPEWDYYHEIDYFYFNFCTWFPWKLLNTSNPSVDMIYDKIKTKLDNYLFPLNRRYGKPNIFSLGVPSFDGAIMQIIHWDDENITGGETGVTFDGQEQADMYEAFFRYVAERDIIHGVQCFWYNYWDALDHSPSVRAKPVEKEVIAKWFKWFSPKRVSLSISSTSGGTTKPSPASYIKKKGKTVNLKAIASPGYKFIKWRGKGTKKIRYKNPATLKMNKDKVVKAIFQKID